MINIKVKGWQVGFTDGSARFCTITDPVLFTNEAKRPQHTTANCNANGYAWSRCLLPVSTSVGLVQSHTLGAPPQSDDRVVFFDSEMARSFHRRQGVQEQSCWKLRVQCFFGKLPPIVFTANNKVGNWKAPRQMPMTIRLGTGNSGAW